MSKMKLWHIPDPWDYHQYGGYVVLASTQEAAIAIVKERVGDRSDSYYKSDPEFDNITEIEGKVYALSGCDC